MKILSRRPVTLLELLLVIGLIALVAGFIAININRALTTQKFQSEVALVLGELRLAQDLMLILNTDVHVKFAKEDQGPGIKYWLELETKLPKGIHEQVLRKKKSLKTIHGLFFKDSLPYPSTPNQVDIKFLSKGTVMSEGILRLATADQESTSSNALEVYICLPGYPYPIVNKENRNDAEKICALNDSYDARLTQDTFARLTDEIKKGEEEKEKSEEEGKKSQGSKEEKGSKDAAEGS